MNFLFILLLSANTLAAQGKATAAQEAVKRGAYAEAEAAIGVPESIEERYWLGRAQVALDKYDDAESHFREILAEKPDSSAAYEGLARIDIARKNYAQALQRASKAVELDSQNSEAFYVQGIAYAYRNDFRNSAASLEKALALNPTHAYAHYHLGLVQYRQKRYDRTVIHFEKFLELMPDAPEAGQVRSILKTVRG